MIDYNQLKKANIYLRSEFVGRIEKTERLTYLFKYDEEWIKKNSAGIGLALPTQKKIYESKELLPFFDNLIPEGWLLSHAQHIFKIDKSNRFAILLATGRETVGAVKVVAVNEDGKEIELDKSEERQNHQLKLEEVKFYPAAMRCPYCFLKLSEKQFKKSHFHQVCAKKMWGTTRQIKTALDSRDPLNSFRQTIHGASISGAQRKGLFNFQKGVLTPTHKESQYIIKPQGDYPYLPENEHLTMSIAKEVGFLIPPFTIFSVEKIGMVFAIRRFDLDANGVKLRLEDFGQILEMLSNDKYESSYNKLGKAINKFSDAPLADLFEMWKRLLFSFFIGNGDMHLKNWSLIELDSTKGIFRLSPCYDFLNTRLPIPDEDVDLALTLSGKKHKITKDLFVEFAKELKIEHLIERVFDELDHWMMTAENFAKDSYLPDAEKIKYVEIVKSRYEVLKGRERNYL